MEERRMMRLMFRPCFFWLFVMLLLWPCRPCNLDNVFLLMHLYFPPCVNLC